VGFLTSLFIEILQLVSARGIFQADDIITNTIGSLVGYLLYGLFVAW
jgi:glycopeptide antibiotics resistance protein